WRRLAVVAVAVLGVLRETGLTPVPLPQNRRQIPQDVLRRGVARGAAQFGFELGTGVRTYVPASAPYVLALAVLLVGQQLHVAVLAGLGFGVGRAAAPLARYASGAGEAWDVRMSARLRVISVGGAVVIAVCLALLLA
ncbi:MAG: hypothetical protein ACRDTQ_08255, partial [Micromonosporaceae bacterium]